MEEREREIIESNQFIFHCRYYEDFHTIDWIRDKTKDHLRHKHLEKNKKLTVRGFINRYYDAISGWILVFLVGVASGLFAGNNELQ